MAAPVELGIMLIAAALARLEVEHPLAGGADGAGREEVGGLEVEGRAHPRSSPARSPSSEFTVKYDGFFASGYSASAVVGRWDTRF